MRAPKALSWPCFKEQEPGRVKVSLRSKSRVDVNRLALKFEGEAIPGQPAVRSWVCLTGWLSVLQPKAAVSREASRNERGFNVLKPPGMTSHDVVSFLRRQLQEKRIGHAGTLDPQAAGVLLFVQDKPHAC